MKRPLLVAAAALTAAGLLTGCAGAQPGVAARVGEETISVSHVNQIADGYCRAYERQLLGDGSVVPMQVLTSSVVQTLAMTSAAGQLADDYDVTPSAAYTETLANLEQSGEVLPAAAGKAKVELESSEAYVTDLLGGIGRKTLAEDGVEEPSSDDALARGRDLLSVWLASHETEFDPQYGVALGEQQPEFADTSVSFAVSDLAVQGSAAEADPAYVRSLPESQRCG